MRILLSALTGLTFGSAAALAVAPPTSASVRLGSLEVSYDDLNVSTNVGADRLLRRIRRAAQHACAGGDITQPFAKTVGEDACRRDMVDLAVREAASPVLTARYDGRVWIDVAPVSAVAYSAHARHSGIEGAI